MLTNTDGRKTDEVSEQVQAHLNKILSFKQIEQDRQYTEVKKKVKQEEADRIAAEEAAAAAEQEAAAKQPEEGEAPEEEENAEQDKSAAALEKNQAQSLQKHEDRASKSSLHSRTSQHMSVSKQSAGAGVGGSRKTKRVAYTRDHKIKIWEEMESGYIKEGILALSDIKRQRESLTDGLNGCQRQFIQFLERPCQKQEKVNEFVQSFNKFSLEFPDLRKDDQTKEELMNRAERLSTELWSIIDMRKSESLDQIAAQSSGGWSDQEMR